MRNFSIYFTLVAAMLFWGNALQAQEEGKFRGGLNLGAAIPSGGVGFMADLEFKYNIADRMNVGIRFGAAVIGKAITTDGEGEYESADISANGSYLGTFDYYFPLDGSFTPFVGGGLGIYSIASVAAVSGGPDFNAGAVDASTKFGGVIRGGFEAGKFRMGLEFDIIPKTTLMDAAGERELGSINNSYLGVTLGFFIGGGRWG